MTEVTIRPWPSLPTYYTVTLRDGTMGQMGCIGINIDDEFYFHSYAPFDRAEMHDKSLVIEATSAKIAELNILRKITKRVAQ
jgi:hypothetical protein